MKTYIGKLWTKKLPSSVVYSAIASDEERAKAKIVAEVEEREDEVVDVTAMETVDRLDVLFSRQKRLDSRIIHERKVEKTLSEWVIGLTVAIESELDEIRREVNWKWWKNEKQIDMDRLQDEIVDLWHFVLSLSIHAGLTPDELMRRYLRKNVINHERQDGAHGDDYAVNKEGVH